MGPSDRSNAYAKSWGEHVSSLSFPGLPASKPYKGSWWPADGQAVPHSCECTIKFWLSAQAAVEPVKPSQGAAFGEEQAERRDVLYSL